jgi:GntP family gluconate:H+ symporter
LEEDGHLFLVVHQITEEYGHNPPLYISLLPIVVALLLIAFGAVAEATGLEAPVIQFLGDPVFALFLGLLGAYLLAWRTLTNEHVEARCPSP